MVSGAWSDQLIARGVLSTTATRKVMQFIGIVMQYLQQCSVAIW
jgi:hypothetical protein